MVRSSLFGADFDVVIVGARCSGAATAMLLARAGARVLIVDRSERDTDALSTHALMRPAVAQLHRWGILPMVRAAKTPAVTRTTFAYGPNIVPIDIRPRGGIEALYAPRRQVLDQILVDAAVAAGAEVRFRTTFLSAKTDSRGRVRGAHLRDHLGRCFAVRSGLLIGADGLRSHVAEEVGSHVSVRSEHSTATVYGYFSGIENHGYRWYYRPGAAIGAIPTNDGLHCVFVGLPARHFRSRFGSGTFGVFLSLVARFDADLASTLRAEGPREGLRRFAGVPGFLRTAHGPGWALVGDAGYFKDPITAHGISDALLDAERLAGAVMRGNEPALEQYQAERDRFAVHLLQVTDAIAAFDWSLEELSRLHQELNRLMNAEIQSPPGPVGPARAVA